MSKKHLKRLNAPKSWQILKKEFAFIMRSSPGPHSLKFSVPIGVLIRDILAYAKTLREVKYILNNKNILVDGIRRLDHKFPVGLFDTLEFSEAKKTYRALLDQKGRIVLIPISAQEAKVKLCKIAKKFKVKGKTQLNFHDGVNILVDKDDYKVGDTLVLELPKKTVKEHIKFGKGVTVYLVAGKHTGQIGKVEDIKADKISYKNQEGEVLETLKDYAFVVGKDKPAISLSAK